MAARLVERWLGRSATLPPVGNLLAANLSDDSDTIVAEPTNATSPQPISAFVCLIDYAGETRFITCRRYDIIGEIGYVGAICNTASGYRQFRCDRIASVSDAYTGEVLGDGSYFDRFEITSRREITPTWGLPPARKAVLVGGLNILAFMARCDGRWHPLENESVEQFVCSMWLRKEWDGDPPIDEIMHHAQRLAPDADTFFKALNYYARSSTSTAVLKNAVSNLIAADGVICAAENDWAYELSEYLEEHSDYPLAGEEVETWILRELG